MDSWYHSIEKIQPEQKDNDIIHYVDTVNISAIYAPSKLHINCTVGR